MLFVGLSVITPGCIVLPVPSSRVEGYGVASQVVDAQSGSPVVGAKVVDVADEHRAVTTNADGRFRLEPHVQMHWGYLWGAISYPIWPFTGDVVILDRTVRVIGDGYDEAEFTLSPLPKGRENTGNTIAVENDVLLVPSLPVHRRPATRPPASGSRSSIPSEAGRSVVPNVEKE
jgi:hypothetical protein